MTFIQHVQAPFLKQQAFTKSAKVPALGRAGGGRLSQPANHSRLTAGEPAANPPVPNATPPSPLHTQVLADAGIGPFIPNEVTASLLSGCKLPAETQWCYDLFNFMFYGPSWFMSSYDMQRVAATWPSTASVRNLVHWSQMWHARRGLQMFDYGQTCPGTSSSGPKPYLESCNAAKYGQDSPPLYDISRVTTKAAVLEAETDMMATKEDVAQLMATWKADVRHHKVIPRGSHMDFVWARAPPMRQDIINILWAEVPR